MKPEPITVKAHVTCTLSDAWAHFTTPGDIMQWNSASEDWHCPSAELDLRPGGRFRYRMAARDGSAAFDFSGRYTAVETQALIAFTLDDGRNVRVSFGGRDGDVTVTETFDPETLNAIELQREGWQAILNRYAALCN
jgi:uncharacterized protein YndB with AHSA1/START domain